MTTLPIAFVGQVHGRSVRMCLERVLTPMTEALPGDIVAVRESGLYLDNASFINSSQFLLRTQKGVLQLRLSDLPEKKHRICAEALGRLSNDWELYGDLAEVDEGQLLDEDGGAAIEVVRFLNGVGIVRSAHNRVFGEAVSSCPGSISALVTEGSDESRPAPSEPERNALYAAWQQIISGRDCVAF